MPCAASGDDSKAWQAPAPLLEGVALTRVVNPHPASLAAPRWVWAEQITDTSQDVLSTLSRRGWRDAQRLLELRNPKPSRLHHSVASRRRACRARRRVLPKPRSARPFFPFTQPRASKIVNRVEIAFSACFILSSWRSPLQ